jgi:hypothetical protein
MRFLNHTVTIPDLSDTNGSIELTGSMLVVVAPDANFDGAAFALETSFDEGASWPTVQDDAGEDVSTTVAAGDITRLTPSEFASAKLPRLVSDTAQAGDYCVVYQAE